MPDTASSFVTLLNLARQGDQNALAELTRQYEPKIRVVAHVLLGPALRPYLDSTDVVQSVHHCLMLGLRSAQFELSRPEDLLALALTLVRRKVARHWRRLQRQKRLSSDGSGSGDLKTLLLSLSAPPDDPAQAAQFKDQLAQLCSNLNEIEQRILDARLQGYSTAEIAQQVGLHPIALRVRMTRLRQRLESTGVLSDWL